MDFDTIITHLSALGFDVKNGYIIKDKYRFGRLNKNVIVPEDDVSPENEYADIESIYESNSGCGGINLTIVTIVVVGAGIALFRH